MDLGAELSARLSAGVPSLHLSAMLAAALIALALTGIPEIWVRMRLLVTLVHELGHAAVGLLAGRRFTGFVVRADMSGHAVTVGPERGFGRIAMTWAGYPTPALLGLLMLWATSEGYAAALLGACLLALVVALVFARSAGTVATVVITAVVIGALWWWRVDSLQTLALTATGITLIAGSWRHLGALIRSGRGQRSSDPAVLAQLTRVPVAIWIMSFAIVHAGVSWAAYLIVRAMV